MGGGRIIAIFSEIYQSQSEFRQPGAGFCQEDSVLEAGTDV